VIKNNFSIIEKSMSENFVIPEFDKFKNEVKDIFESIKKNNTEGKVADYIPELANANPTNWGVSVCTIDG
jgi:glutaminase